MTYTGYASALVTKTLLEEIDRLSSKLEGKGLENFNMIIKNQHVAGMDFDELKGLTDLLARSKQ